MERTLQASFYTQLERNPDRRCIGFVNAAGEPSWLTWQEFHDRAARNAGALAGHGLKQGDVCVVLLPSGEVAATLLLGILLLGGVPLLIAPPLLRGENETLLHTLKRILHATHPRIVVCPRWMASMVEPLGGDGRERRFLFAETDLAGDGSGLPRVLPAETDIAALQLTSGSTGFPRVCQWRQQGVMASLSGMFGAMKLSPEDVCFNWTPLYHDMGLVNNFFLCLAGGVPLALASPHDFVKQPVLWLRGLMTTGATQSWSPNFGFALSVRKVRDDDLHGIRLDHVRALWNAAERVHLETMERFYERFARTGLRYEALKTNFGCAENVGGATFSDPDGPFIYERVDGGDLLAKGIARPLAEDEEGHPTMTVVSVGRPVAGMQTRVLSRTGQVLPDGRVGELALLTPSRMNSYVGDRAGTRRAHYGDLLRTGDLAYLRGEEVFWVGRVRERMNVQGRKFDPSYFESILATIPELRPGCFVAFGVDDEERGTERIIVASEVVDPVPPGVVEAAHQIRDRISLELGVEISEVLLVPSGTLTKTSSGKRRHRHFRQLYLEGKLQALQVRQGENHESPVHSATDQPSRLGG